MSFIIYNAMFYLVRGDKQSKRASRDILTGYGQNQLQEGLTMFPPVFQVDILKALKASKQTEHLAQILEPSKNYYV